MTSPSKQFCSVPRIPSPGPRMGAYVAFPSLKKETLAGFPLWRSYPCPGCLCCLLWISGCGVQS